MSPMRADDEVNVTLTPQGEAALDELAEAMAATYDGKIQILAGLLHCLHTADVDTLATDLAVVADDLLSVDDVERRFLNAEQNLDVPGASLAERQTALRRLVIEPRGWALRATGS